MHFWKEEAELGTYSWFDRVRSESNPADAPSRLEFAALKRAGVVSVAGPRPLRSGRGGSAWGSRAED